MLLGSEQFQNTDDLEAVLSLNASPELKLTACTVIGTMLLS